MTQPQTAGLDNLRIASPCPANWDEMTGDDRARFCKQCQLTVYNLSGMTHDEAEALLAEREGRLCVRYYQRADGTVITKDCPVGVDIRHKKVLRLRRAGIAAAITLVTLAGAFIARAESPHATPQPIGQITAPPPEGMTGKLQPQSTQFTQLPHTMGKPAMMGEMVSPANPPVHPPDVPVNPSNPDNNNPDHKKKQPPEARMGDITIPRAMQGTPAVTPPKPANN